MIKAVLFDIDNTLYSYDRAHAQAFPKLLAYAERELGIPAGEFREDYSREYKAIQAQLGASAAIHNRLIRIQRILEKRSLPLTPHVLRMNDLYWDSLIDAMEPSPHAEETLRRLKAAGIRIGCGTDMTARVQFQKLERLGVLDTFDFLVSSEEAGEEKPSPGFFALCAQKAECSPEECLFVGDSRKKDVCGALAAGMAAAWYCPEADDAGGRTHSHDPEKAQKMAPEAAHGLTAETELDSVTVIRDLAEIPELLKLKMNADR